MTMQKETKNKDFVYWINTVITIVLMFGIGYLEPWGFSRAYWYEGLGYFYWVTLGLDYNWICLAKYVRSIGVRAFWLSNCESSFNGWLWCSG